MSKVFFIIGVILSFSSARYVLKESKLNSKLKNAGVLVSSTDTSISGMRCGGPAA
ncbi:MAG: hypothetical protein H6622_13300 [Halobacteriovoraceae bacterium]|nr:hypothetical protein [Halobacteriovoraceae bacterium]